MLTCTVVVLLLKTDVLFSWTKECPPPSHPPTGQSWIRILFEHVVDDFFVCIFFRLSNYSLIGRLPPPFWTRKYLSRTLFAKKKIKKI